jgi:hypothetical protein
LVIVAAVVFSKRKQIAMGDAPSGDGRGDGGDAGSAQATQERAQAR